MPTNFASFQRVFPPASPRSQPLADSFVDKVTTEFGVAIPPELIEFWNVLGPGYYGENELYFFGGDDSAHRDVPRHDLIAWNGLPCWRKILPEPRDGGPLFFAETCFGEQLGFHYERGVCLPVLLIVDTMESFVLGRNLTELFEVVLAEHFAVTDPDRYHAVRDRLGPLPAGKHYAPILFPLLGGTGDADNFQIADPVVHLATTIAVFEAIQDLPPGTPISGIKLEFDE